MGVGESPLVVTLTGQSLPVADIGGKGAWLDRLIAADQPVPDVAVVTTDAYRLTAATPEIAALVSRLTSATEQPPTNPAVDQAFAAVALPPAVEAALQLLTNQFAGQRLAVRSSATAEDTGALSFAGQYDSLLNVTPAELPQAVRQVWASLWHEAPRAYRAFHGVADTAAAMAVVIMPMIPAQRAGVAFTVDPSDAEYVRVETVTGLGEKLVSGRATPTVELLPRSDLAERSGSALTSRVAELALSVERTFGVPQDIEWAWDGQQLFLLQARPITTIDSTKSNARPSRLTVTWTTAGIEEMLPGVLPPLLWDTTAMTLAEAFRSLAAQLSPTPELVADEVPVLRQFRGRAAVNKHWLDRISGKSPATGASESSRRQQLRWTRVRSRAARQAEIMLVATDRVLPARDDASPDGSLTGLLAQRHRMFDLFQRAMNAEVATATVAVAEFGRVQQWLSPYLGDVASLRWAQRLTSGSGTTIWAELADTFPTEPRALLVGDVEWDAAEAQLLATSAGQIWVAAFAAASRRAGSLSQPGGATWSDDPQAMWQAVRAAATSTAGANRAEQVHQREVDWDVLLSEIEASPTWRKSLFPTPVDPRFLLLRRLVLDAGEWLQRREHTKAAVLALGGELYRQHLAIGEQLSTVGVLANAADVLLLTATELRNAAEEPAAFPTAAVLQRRAVTVQQWQQEDPLPVSFADDPATHLVTELTDVDGVIRGWGASPGQYRGRVAVRSDPHEGIATGDVLVTTNTDASWSPIFLKAGAIIVERGGPLSHAAIVARELGIPAVLNATGAVAAAQSRNGDNDVIAEVDGDSGEVRWR
ncbi:MAG: hypothetical protein K0U60_05165 [Actinomycetia bacterium]|nr:hypothetical protein [Actinomycetes bacterium]MCH9800419.1 hypothetical protein [Actinomycetes bacterium]